MPASHRCCPAPCAGGCGGMSEPIGRIYRCRLCTVEVYVCRRCDHGQIYCAGECSRICRRESLRRAGARYQRTRRGARHHAARQLRWRQRRIQQSLSSSEVTHHGCSTRSATCTVSAAQKTEEPTHGHAHENNSVDSGAGLPAQAAVGTLAARCDFCQARDRQDGGDDPVGGVSSHGAGVASVAATLRGTA